METLIMLAGVLYIGMIGFRAMGKVDEFLEQGGFLGEECVQPPEIRRSDSWRSVPIRPRN